MDQKKYKKRDGISLLIGLGLVFAIMFFALLVGNVVVSSVRQSANVNRSNEAYYGAEGALEQGLLENYYKGIGYTSDEYVIVYDDRVSAKFKIEGQVPFDLKYASGSAYNGKYGIPTPGTGNVGTECDPLNPEINGPGFAYPGGDFSNEDAADHPCNWNKIKVGQSVTVPLYRIGADGSPVNLFTKADQNLILRVRTPCKDGSEMCFETERAEFTFISCNPTVDPVPCNDPLISWQIAGYDDTSLESLVLGPYIKYKADGDILGVSTIITEARFYGNPTFIVLDQSFDGVDFNLCQGELIKFLINQDDTFNVDCSLSDYWLNFNLEEPIFKFSVISALADDLGNNVPHLEYQLLTSSNLGAPPTNVSQIIKAEGISGTFKQVLEVKQPQESGLLEYVIQQ